MLPFDSSCLKTESDVEQKFIYPLLTTVLGFHPAEIKTKEHLAPTDIDKGAGKRLGYYPDYLLYIGGIPTAVIEAKAPGVSVNEGYREARLYAGELNKGYASQVNPVQFVLAVSSDEIVFSPWDSEADAIRGRISDLVEGSRLLESLRAAVGRSTLAKRADQLRRAIFPRKRFRPLSLIGGPSRQTEVLAPNTFSADLIPLLRRYFDPDETAHSREIIERAYVSSNEVTSYTSDLEALLKDRVRGPTNAASIQTTKSRAEAVDVTLKKAVAERKDNPDPLILLVGGVGSGKSIFLERYFEFLIPADLAQKILRVTINFNQADASLKDVENWTCAEFVRQLEQRFGPEFVEHDNLCRYFAPDINRLERGPLKGLKDADPRAHVRAIAEHLQALFANPQSLAFGIARFFIKDKDTPVVVIFDNVDRRDRDQQLKIFQTVQWFRNATKCFSILTLRDETYDAYKNEPPLDAFLKPFAFRIAAPRLINVVKKRLELAIQYLVENSAKKLRYELANGIHIEYPASKLGSYLLTIYLSVFNQKRKVGVVLEALAGRDTRRALEMFTEILTSGYFTDEAILKLTEGEGTAIPEWLILRMLMRTRHRFFSSRFGYVQNIFEVPEDSSTASNYLLSEVLNYLAVNRKSSRYYNIEGYLLVSDLLVYFGDFGFTVEDVLWALELCLNRALITADHQRTKGIKPGDYVRITASGYFHLRLLTTRLEYLSNVAFDTPVASREIAQTISRFITDSQEHRRGRAINLLKSLREERYSLNQAIPDTTRLAKTPEFLLKNAQAALDFTRRHEDIPEDMEKDLFT